MSLEQKNYRLGQLVIKPKLGEFEKNGEPVHLDPILMAILVHLIQAAPNIVSSKELLNQFWNNTVVEESTIHRRISQLRQALDDNARNPIYIATIPKRGYRIIANTSLWNEDNITSNSIIGRPATENQVVSAAKRFTPVKVLVCLLIIAVTGLFSYSAFFNDSGLTNEKQQEENIFSPSIAVLPFQDFSESANNSHLVTGFHDDIIMKLAQINNLRVISRTSVNRYSSGTSRSVPNIADELGVSHIIEGSLRRTDNRIKITIQLIDGSKDKHIWGATYERGLENLFSIQSEIAQKIASILAIESPVVKSLRFDKAPTDDLPAYELVLRGRELIDVGTVESLEQASEIMAKAIAVDPKLAEAHAGYSRSLFLQTFLGVQWHQVRARSLLASEKALELDPQSASIHTNYAHIRGVWEYDEETAMLHYQKALELEPNNSFSLLHYGAHLSIQLGRPVEALPLLERAMILDPLSGEVGFYLAWTLRDLNRNAEAHQVVTRVLKFDPQDLDLLTVKISLLFENGDLFSAFRKINTLVNLDPSSVQSHMAIIYPLIFLGKYSAAQKWIDRLSIESPNHVDFFGAQAYLFASLLDFEGLSKLCKRWNTLNTFETMEQNNKEYKEIFYAECELSTLLARADNAHDRQENELERVLRQSAVEKALIVLTNKEGNLAITRENRATAVRHAFNLRVLSRDQEAEYVLEAALRHGHAKNEWEASVLFLAYALLGKEDEALALTNSEIHQFFSRSILESVKEDKYVLYKNLSQNTDFVAFFSASAIKNKNLFNRISSELPTLLKATTGQQHSNYPLDGNSSSKL